MTSHRILHPIKQFMPIMTTTLINEYNDHWWTEICKKVKRAVVFIDEKAVECLHWHGGLARLEKAGVLAVKDLSTFETGEENQKKAVFIVSTVVVNLVQDILKDIIKNSKFEYCTVITNASQAVHKAAKYPGREVEDSRVFAELEDQVLEWMGNFNYTCEIFHIPFHSASISTNLFVMPAFRTLVPMLGVDVDRANELLKVRKGGNDLQSVSENGNLVYEALPYEVQVSVSHLTTSLHALFQMLNIKEDIFTVGSFSRMVGEQLEGLHSARQRRKSAPNKISLLLIDRSLDLAEPATAGTTLMSKILANLPTFPGHTNDVGVNMAELFGMDSSLTQKDLFPLGCLKDPGSDDENDIKMDDLIMDNETELITKINDKLKQVLQLESDQPLEETLQILSKTANKISEESVGVVQKAQAIVQANKSKGNKVFKQVREVRKKFLPLVQAKKREMKGFLVQITKMVRTRKERGLCLDDIVLIIANLYFLLPPDESFYPEDEDRLQSALSEAIVKDKDNLGPVLFSMTKDSDVDELLAFQMVKTIFTRLNSVVKARAQLKAYQYLVNNGQDHPFLEQLMDDIFAEDRRDVPDLEHRAGGLGGLLKSGIGFLGVNVSKMHPRENPAMWIIVLGGITPSEVRSIRTLVQSRSQCQLVIGSTRLLSPWSCLDTLFNIDPLQGS